MTSKIAAAVRDASLVVHDAAEAWSKQERVGGKILAAIVAAKEASRYVARRAASGDIVDLKIANLDAAFRREFATSAEAADILGQRRDDNGLVGAARRVVAAGARQ